MRLYFETLFRPEYFPYWEFSMLMMLALVISLLIRLIRIEKLLKDKPMPVTKHRRKKRSHKQWSKHQRSQDKNNGCAGKDKKK